MKHGASLLTRLSALALALTLGALSVLSCAGGAPGLRVITGTTLIAEIVRDIAGDRVTVDNIVPAATCPGQYDVKPSDVAAAVRGNLLLMHDYQQQMQDVKGVINAANNSNLAIKVIAVPGNWLVPAVHASAIDSIAATLSGADPADAAYFSQRASERRA